MSGLATDFSRLAAMVSEIGVSIHERAEAVLEQLETGVEVDSEVEFIGAPSGFFDLLPNGDIVRVIVHLGSYQAKSYRGRVAVDPSAYHKYHLHNCPSIKGAPPTRRLRYTKTVRSDGAFAYHVLNPSGKEMDPEAYLEGRRLELCGHCRNKLQSLFYFPVFEEDFVLSEFIENFKDSAIRFEPQSFRKDGDEIRGFRHDDWLEIANYAKARAGWQCGTCGVDLHAPGNRRFLHAHFEHGILLGALGNVQVHCIRCHANEGGSSHRRIRRTREFLEFDKLF